MSKGENIFKRKDGRWEARYTKGYEISGKIKYGYCYGKTYKEAKDKVTKIKAAIINGTPTENSRRRFSYYCDLWLKDRKISVREATYVKYSAVVKKHILPRLGGCFTAGINEPVINAFTDELLETGLKAKTVHDILVILNGIIRFASVSFAGVFPQVKITYPKEKKKEMRVLTREEQERFVAYLSKDGDPCKFGVLLALYTGIRIGELCALKWSDISQKDGTLCVNSTMQRLYDTSENSGSKTRVVMGDPKSDTSARVIPLTGQAVSMCEKMNPGDGDAFVLTGTHFYMEPRLLQYRIEKYTRDCGLDGVHCHTLRHTFATRAVEVGFEIKSLSEVLGHANTTITLERYVHSSMEFKRNNMSKLAAAGF